MGRKMSDDEAAKFYEDPENRLPADDRPGRRHQGLGRQLHSHDQQWWWLSFVDPSRPIGKRFLGVAVLPAQTVEDVITLSHLTGCNPGGEIALLPIPTEAMHKIPLTYRNRLLSQQEAESL